MAIGRVEPAKISYAQKYDIDKKNSYNQMLGQGYKPQQLSFLLQPTRWGNAAGTVNNQMVDNPAYVDTSKGSHFRYNTGSNKLAYAPKGSTYYTDEDLTEADLTPGIMGDIRGAYGDVANSPLMGGVAATYNKLLGSEKAKQLGAASPELFGGSRHSLNSDILGKMWR